MQVYSGLRQCRGGLLRNGGDYYEEIYGNVDGCRCVYGSIYGMWLG